MVKFALILIALLAPVAGGVLVSVPGWYVELAQTEPTNLAWMRFFGAGLVSIQGFGLFIAAFRRRDTNPLVGLIALASTAETGVLWYSLVTGEFSAGALWAVIVPGVVATAGAVLLWGAWLSRRKSVRALVGTGRQAVDGGSSAGTVPADESAGVPEAGADAPPAYAEADQPHGDGR